MEIETLVKLLGPYIAQFVTSLSTEYLKNKLHFCNENIQNTDKLVELIKNCSTKEDIAKVSDEISELANSIDSNKAAVDQELKDFAEEIFRTIPTIGMESEVLLVTTVVIRITDQVSKLVDLKPTLESDLGQNNIPVRVEDLYENTILLSYDEPTDKDEVQELIDVVKDTLSGYGTDIRSITYI